MREGRIVGGRYQVGRLLGRGGMSSVYGGVRLADGRQVALKVAQKQEDGAVLAREYRLLRELRHGGIVEVLDYLEADDTYILVTEYIEGEDLRRKKNREETFSPEQVRLWGISLVCILAYLHEQSVWYLDMKPANIMCRPDGGLVLVDFGAALSKRECSGQMLGTKGYASPEQLAGRAFDQRSDIYSLGVTLFQLWTGTLYEGEFPNSRNFLAPILRGCLQELPEKRYSSDGELLRDLLDGKAGSRRRVLASLFRVSVAAIGCLVVWSAFGMIRWQKDRQEEQVEQQLLAEDDGENLCLVFPQKSEGYRLYLSACREDGVLSAEEEDDFLELCSRVPTGEEESCFSILRQQEAAYREVCAYAKDVGLCFGSWDFAKLFCPEEAAVQEMIHCRQQLLLGGEGDFVRYWELLMAWREQVGEDADRRILREMGMFFSGFSQAEIPDFAKFWQSRRELTDMEEWKLLESLFAATEQRGEGR